MEDFKKREDVPNSPPKRRRFSTIFKSRKESTSADCLIQERRYSFDAKPTGVETETEAENGRGLPAQRRERSSTLDSCPVPHRLEAAATVKEKRLRKRATVSFEMGSLSEELANLAAEDKAAAMNGRHKKSPHEANHRGSAVNTLQRSTSWADVKKLSALEAPVTTHKTPSSSDGIPASQATALHFRRSDQPASASGAKRDREDVVSVGKDLPEEVRKRNQVINEIINTERDYVHDLHTMVSLFKNPMLEENIVTKEELGVMFSNVHLLIEVNKMLLTDIVQRVKDTDGNELGDSFLLLGDYLKMYATYCGHHASAVELVGSYEKTNARFRAFLARAYTQTNRLTLRDFLIKPVQRICKYPLLLRELIKCTDSNHPDFIKLTSALTKIQTVVGVVNERKQQEDGVEAMAKVIRTLKNTEKFGIQFMVPGRQYLQEGTLLETSKRDRSEFFPRHYFLFSDLLVLTVESSNKGSSKKGSTPTGVHEVVEVLPFSEAHVNLKMNGLEDKGNSVEIESVEALYVLPFITAEQKRKWIHSHLLSMERSSPQPPRRKQSS